MAVHEIIEQAEHEALQSIIDEQEGLLGMEESQRLGEASPEDMESWNKLVVGTVPVSRTPKRRNWRRLLIAIAVLMALLAVSACSIHIINFVKRYYEHFTELRVADNAEAVISSWRGACLPTSLPAGYFVSDALDLGDYRAIEYSNSEGGRFYFYQSGEDTTQRIDTENSKSWPSVVGILEGETVSKDNLSTLSWSDNWHCFSIEYDPAQLSEEDVSLIAKSVAPK